MYREAIATIGGNNALPMPHKLLEGLLAKYVMNAELIVKMQAVMDNQNALIEQQGKEIEGLRSGDKEIYQKYWEDERKKNNASSINIKPTSISYPNEYKYPYFETYYASLTNINKPPLLETKIK